MSSSSFGDWHFTFDRAATAAAYRQAGAGWCDVCGCKGCRNFVAARARAFPEPFLRLLESLGIDPCKDGEIYHLGCERPGRHVYEGWFHFVGELHEAGDFAVVELGDGCVAWLCRAGAPRLASLEDLPVVQLEFHLSGVPWLLDEPEPA